MKISINPKELLALHDVLNEHLRNADEGAVDSSHLRQVHNRIRAMIIAGLTDPNKVVDPVDSWLKHESAKIARLKQQGTPTQDRVPDEPMVQSRGPIAGGILTDNEGEIVSDLSDYPKPRCPPAPNMPHHRGKNRGFKK